MKIKVVNKSTLELPEYKTQGSAGMDLRASIPHPIVLKPLGRVLVPTGLFMEIPKGFEGQIRGRSGLALKYGISLANGIGTIDSDYRGEIKVILINLGEDNFVIENGARIAQFVLSKYQKVRLIEVDQLDNTERNKGGFGHTGV